MKYELKIEFKDKVQLSQVIQQSYFEDGTQGKLVGKKSHLKIEKEDPLFIVFKGLNNMTAKILNEEVIDGSVRCVVDETEDVINLYPVNPYCIVEDEKYSFY
jgi:hypothetical protein